MSTRAPTVITVGELDAVLDRSLLPTASPAHKLLGVEFERIPLHRETAVNAPLSFCQELFADVVRDLDAAPIVDDGVLHRANADGFNLSMEPSGQFEVSVAPTDRLTTVDRALAAVDAVVDARLASTPYELVALGFAPVTPVAELGLLPRNRYRIMDARMIERGALSRHMMRGTAGFQLTYDVGDVDDAARKLSLLFRLSPVLLALSANSSRVEGGDSGYRSYRHHVWLHTDRARSGVPAGCLRADTAIDGYRRFARQAAVLFLHGEGGLEPAPQGSLEELAGRGLVTSRDVELHLSSLFPLVRLRQYLELRCFDAVAWPLARSIAALVSGIVYCPNATATAEQASLALMVDDPDELRELHEQAARSGLDAIAPDGTVFRDLAATMLDCAGNTLGAADCAWATAADLDAVSGLIRGE